MQGIADLYLVGTDNFNTASWLLTISTLPVGYKGNTIASAGPKHTQGSGKATEGFQVDDWVRADEWITGHSPSK